MDAREHLDAILRAYAAVTAFPGEGQVLHRHPPGCVLCKAVHQANEWLALSEGKQ